ncbi:MAG TPA: translocation/assembly module TamB domain-containing protein [Noviherbaspirillum sp.]|nr:translocation/assembly module TamB domain-containing protein [Noviherbaspirillum sp.]
MASEPAKQVPSPRRARLRRGVMIALGVTGIALVLLAGFAAWLLGTEGGARFALSTVAQRSGNTLRADGVHGRLAGPLRIESLILEQPDRRITLTDLRIDWRPQALLDETLHLTSVQLAHFSVSNKINQKKEPAKLPEKIGLPFKLRADQVRVTGGDIGRGPVNLVKLGTFALSLDYDGSRYRLCLHEFAAGSALENGNVATRFSGEATLSAQKPYALDATFSSRSSATMEERQIGAAGQVRLGGSLAELMAELDLMVNRAPVQGSAVLRPFSDNLLGPAKLTAQELDLAGLDPKLPVTALDIDFANVENGAGELSVRNRAAGQYAQRRLPLALLQVRFRQESGQVHFDKILARPGTQQLPAGDIAGSGRYADGALALTLNTDALNLQRIDKRMRATRLAGEVDLRHADGKQEFTIALTEPLDKNQRVALNAHGVLADAELKLDRAELQAGSGRIDASAQVALSGKQAFSAQGKISRFRLQDLGTFKDAPSLLLNGNFMLHGARQPGLEADLAFNITDSTLEGQPLVGDGKVQLRGEQLRVPRFQLASGANRLDLQGRLAQDDSTLSFTLDAPQLAQLGKRFGGTLQANGIVRGTMEQPRINAEWSASKARIPGDLRIESMQGKADVSIDRKQAFIVRNAVADLSARGLAFGANQVRSLTAQIRFAPQPEAPLTVTMQAEGIATSRLHADRFAAHAQGVTSRHTIDLSLQEPGAPPQAWTLQANGGMSRLSDNPRWQGSIERFDATGRIQARLVSKAYLLLSAQRIQLDDFLMDIAGGRVALQRFVRDNGSITTRGQIDRLQLAQVLPQLTTAPPVKTDLEVGGNWDLRIADTVSGTIILRRERGDVTMLGAAPLTLGLRSLNASIAADDGRIAMQLHADGAQLGRIDVNAASMTGSGASRLSIAPGAPVSGRAQINVPSLRWIAPLVSPSLLADGRLQSEVSLTGSFSQPRLTGRIAGEALRLTWAEFGLDLRDGVLQSDFEGEQLAIRNLQFQGSEGSVRLSGPIDFRGGSIAAQLALAAERFAVLNRADRHLVVSGESRIVLKDRRADINGAFTVNSGSVDIGSASKPQLSDDVVVVGREEKPAAKTAASIDVSISLGDGVTVKGRGLDGVLVGQARLLSAPGEALRAQGTLNIAKGTYAAYGRELAIEKGVLRFRGPLNNPALDILAMRRGQEVEAGVSVQGTVLQPRITLVSEPTVPDSEKLSWLVLGRGLASAGESDMGALQAAAAALLSKSAQAGVESRIASAFGLDAFSVGTSQDTLQERIVTLGKQISSRLYVSYQQGLESAASVVQLRYILSPKLSLEAEAGTRSALSLFYNIAFD